MGGILSNCFNCMKSENSTSTANPVDKTGIEIDRTTSDRLETEELLQNPNLHSYDSNNYKKSILVLNGSAKNDNLIQTAKESQLVDNAINKLFEEYKDDNEDAILSEGIERLCTDLDYKPDQFEVLVLAFCLDAEQMCCFTKKEFIHGLKKLNATTLHEIKARLNQKVDKLQNDMELFKQLYRFTFRFGLESGHRILSIDMAIILWRLVYTIHTPDILDRWLSFLENDSNIRGIPKDTWNMFQNFAESFDLASYNSDDAWPSLFDDFVMEYRCEVAKQKQKNNLINNCSQGDSQDNCNNNIDLNNLNYSSLKRGNHQQDDDHSKKFNNVNNQIFKL